MIRGSGSFRGCRRRALAISVLDEDDGLFALFFRRAMTRCAITSWHGPTGARRAPIVSGAEYSGLRVVDVQACAIREHGGRRGWKSSSSGVGQVTLRTRQTVRGGTEVISQKRWVGSRA